MKLNIYVLALTALFAQGCSKDEPPRANSPKQFSDIALSSNDVYPLADGGAYLVADFNDETKIYFLSDSSAQLVTLPKTSDSADIYPLAGGDAYLALAPDAKTQMYHLVGVTATLVTDKLPPAQAVLSKKPFADRFAWVSNQSLRTAQKRDERRREETRSDD